MANKEIRKTQLFLPIFLAIALLAGIYLGTKIVPPASPTIIFPSRPFADINKLNEVLNFVEDAYVDTVDKTKLVETSIEEMLQSLDPHSYYIPPARLSDLTDPLEGNFEGIGVEFRIIRDSVVVVIPLEGGPSEKAGVQAGDRIVYVNDSALFGPEITNALVMNKLKGKVGTPVQISVKRNGQEELIEFALTRDKIPIYSVETAYMMDDQTGYLKLSRFGRHTYDEFIAQTEKLKEQGLKKLIIDLRDNPGGFLSAATQIADEFMTDEELILYTEGKSRARQSYFASEKASLLDTKLYILVNENSASASEILAGAIQDNDRGLILGRRSFGKGLVQEQIEFPDGSAIRLTVARYYTPTGRSIQKPYGDDIKDYHLESSNRLKMGEMYYSDSIKFPDSLKFVTPKGKAVYGGGGIMPDVFIPLDTSINSYFLAQLNMQGIFQQFGFEYTDRNRKKLRGFEDVREFSEDFKVSLEMLNEVLEIAKERSILPENGEVRKFRKWIENRIKANIAHNLWGSDGSLYILNLSDDLLGKTMNLIQKKKDPTQG